VLQQQIALHDIVTFLQVRKLEFLLADAVASQHDCVITIGGIQSNHARATAVAATYLGLPCHLILRNSR
jgi:1-aminocyclopropane-1-carboxylate deaminase/D-cysteine desulfhydrase-like pyridoxal-dependent ACC family enzyme